MKQYQDILQGRPAVLSDSAPSAGGGAENTGQIIIELKAAGGTKASTRTRSSRLRRKLAVVPGATLYLQANQDIRVGGAQSSSQYQYHAAERRSDELDDWAPKMLARITTLPELARCLHRPAGSRACKPRWSSIAIRRRGSEFQLKQIDNTLYDAFGQRQVSTMYTPIESVSRGDGSRPQFQQNPDALQADLCADRPTDSKFR